MIKIKVNIFTKKDVNNVFLETNNKKQQISIPPKENGYGSSTNGGEMLFLALATCFTNDIYRESNYMNIKVDEVSSEVTGEFGSKSGSIAENVVYNVQVKADTSEKDIEKLIRYTDTVSEIQNTLRKGIEVKLGKITCITTKM